MKVIKYLTEIDKEINRFIELSDNKLKIVFRGENKDYKETKLTPSFLREYTTDKEQIFLELLKDYKISEEGNEIKSLIDSQHYIGLSRLLDISSNLLVALYFASESCTKENGYLYVIIFPESVSASSRIYSDGHLIDDNIKLIGDTLTNERVRAQSGGFILFPDSYKPRIPSNLILEFKILSEDKLEIIKELSSYYGISKHRLFPEKDKRGEIIRDRLDGISQDDFPLHLSNYIKKIKDYLEICYLELNMNMLKNGSIMEIKRIHRKFVRVLTSKYTFEIENMKNAEGLESNKKEEVINQLEYEFQVDILNLEIKKEKVISKSIKVNGN